MLDMLRDMQESKDKRLPLLAGYLNFSFIQKTESDGYQSVLSTQGSIPEIFDLEIGSSRPPQTYKRSK